MEESAKEALFQENKSISPSHSFHESNLELTTYSSSLKWVFLDYSNIWRTGLSWSLFFLLNIAVPIVSHFIFYCADCDVIHQRPYNVIVQSSLSVFSALSFISLTSFGRKYGLRRFLFLDKLCDESEKVRQGYALQLQQQLSHVPKFGNWDGENVPYTACFENARKEKANGIRINPNDPQENPEIFNFIAEKNRFHERNTSDQLKSRTYKSTSSTSGSEKTTSDTSVNSIPNPKHRRRKSDRSQIPPLSPVNHADDDSSCRSVAVPKFGEWDEKNPRSAEGFTVIFNKVKEEKQIAAAKFSSVNLQQDVNKYHGSSQKEDTRGKKCCGLF